MTQDITWNKMIIGILETTWKKKVSWKTLSSNSNWRTVSLCCLCACSFTTLTDYNSTQNSFTLRMLNIRSNHKAGFTWNGDILGIFQKFVCWVIFTSNLQEIINIISEKKFRKLLNRKEKEMLEVPQWTHQELQDRLICQLLHLSLNIWCCS